MPLYINLQNHFHALLDNKVALMLAGHVHTYERTHKLLRGYKYAQAEERREGRDAYKYG
jgi:hypothetical protein